jgi:apolipoprotein N-acyltransferase
MHMTSEIAEPAAGARMGRADGAGDGGGRDGPAEAFCVRAVGRSARVALAVGAGALLACAYALHPQAWAPWLAPVPLLAGSLASRRHAALAGWLTGAVALASVLPYYVAMTGWAAALLIALLRAGSWAFATRLTQAGVSRGLPLPLAMLVLPVACAAVELLTLVASPHGAAGSLAYSQMGTAAVVQVAALGGVPAVVFLVLLPGSWAGLRIARPWPRAQRWAAVGMLAAVAAAAAAFAAVRLKTAALGPGVPVTLLGTNGGARHSRDWAAIWATYGPSVVRFAPRGGLVVMPEKLALLDVAGATQAARDVGVAARSTGATLVVGLEVHDGHTFRNRALVAAADGRVAWYDKQRLVPGWEDRDTPGTKPLVVGAGATRVGIAICKDLHVPAIGREYAGAAALLAVPAWDFGEDGWMGARMAALRAIEGGYAVARSARDGMLGAYDAAGRVILEQPVTDAMTIAQVTLPVPHPARANTPYVYRTVYGRAGDAFGWACVVGSVWLLAWTATRGRTRLAP